ncbi:WhiB family transcriptional regulator [Kribbella sp. NPDC003505]|uniref:WhiB family transcriptional regulator n=1 Tax=Kribbella sp. NPDC003505 TaxID=3154448 RepID=UPI0033B7BA3F
MAEKFHRNTFPLVLIPGGADWRDEAAYVDRPANMFPDESDIAGNERARAVCGRCLVTEGCLLFAFASREPWGVGRTRHRRAARGVVPTLRTRQPAPALTGGRGNGPVGYDVGVIGPRTPEHGLPRVRGRARGYPGSDRRTPASRLEDVGDARRGFGVHDRYGLAPGLRRHVERQLETTASDHSRSLSREIAGDEEQPRSGPRTGAVPKAGPAYVAVGNGARIASNQSMNSFTVPICRIRSCRAV